MEFLKTFDANPPLPTDFPSREPSFAVAADPSAEALRARCGSFLKYPRFTKQPRDMVQCFLDITGYTRSSNVLRRHGRKGDVRTLLEHFFLQRKKTNGVAKAAQQPNKIRKKEAHLDFIRRPILVEKDSSDEDLLPTKKADEKSGSKRVAQHKRPSCLVTLQRAKYRERVARERKRIEDTKKEFAEMAEAEVMEKRMTQLSLQPIPKIRSTRGCQLRAQALKRSEQQKLAAAAASSDSSTTATQKRRKCALRTRASPATLPGGGGLKCFNRRSCNPWLDQDAMEDPPPPPPQTPSSKRPVQGHDGSAATTSIQAVAVARAANATRATRATRPTRPTRATHATRTTRATRATRPTYATHATRPTYATRATRPTYATRAANTTHATNATTTSDVSFWNDRSVHIRVNGGGSRPPFK